MRETSGNIQVFWVRPEVSHLLSLLTLQLRSSGLMCSYVLVRYFHGDAALVGLAAS